MNKQLLAGFIAALLMAPVAGAEVVTLSVKDKPLAAVLKEIRAKSGIEFDVVPELAKDTISRTIREDAWQGAVESLLTGYNYEGIWGNDGQLKRIVVSGRNGSGNNSYQSDQITPVAWEDLLSYEQTPADLPEKYRGLPSGSVMAVSIPVDKLNQMKLGEKMVLSLPGGQFEVVYDNRFEHENGDVTWVGYLDGAGKGYRVIITSGQDGSLGQVVSPNGVYNIDLEGGRNWLVDIEASGLRPGSLEHDEADGSLTASTAPLTAEANAGSILAGAGTP